MFASSLLRSSIRSFSTYKPDIAAVKKLRAASQAPIKDVRSALTATEGDFPAAFEWLRKKGIASASKKAGRTAAHGLIGVHVPEVGNVGGLVEVNSETDFVAMNDHFQSVVSDIAQAVANTPTESSGGASVTHFAGEDLGKISSTDGKTVDEIIPELVGKVGENVVVRRGAQFQVPTGLVSSYLHNSSSPGLGKAGAIVALETSNLDKKEELSTIGHRLAMHIVAANPKYLSEDQVPTEVVENEKNILREQAKESGKPEKIIEKMIMGRMKKFYSEITLLDQEHMIEEGNPRIGEFLKKAGKKLGTEIKVASYQRYEVGEKAE